jgi:hypothetical protein
MPANPWRCPFCEHVQPEYDAGAYYHRSDCESRDLRRRIDLALAAGASPDSPEVRRLMRALEQAQYVGD